MREIRLLATTQIRIFQPDVIPLAKILVPQNVKIIQSLFDFPAVQPLEQDGVLMGVGFAGGVYEPGSVVIESLLIEARKIAVKIQGRSEIAAGVFKTVADKLMHFNGGVSLEELVCTHETGAVVVLNFPFDRVFSDKFLSFLRNAAVHHTKNEWSQNFILPLNLKFSVRYKVTDDVLIKSGVSLSSKELVIEPRVQSSADDRLYWTVSPTDTETHFKMIEDLENALG